MRRDEGIHTDLLASSSIKVSLTLATVIFQDLIRVTTPQRRYYNRKKDPYARCDAVVVVGRRASRMQ